MVWTTTIISYVSTKCGTVIRDWALAASLSLCGCGSPPPGFCSWWEGDIREEEAPDRTALRRHCGLRQSFSGLFDVGILWRYGGPFHQPLLGLFFLFVIWVQSGDFFFYSGNITFPSVCLEGLVLDLMVPADLAVLISIYISTYETCKPHIWDETPPKWMNI